MAGTAPAEELQQLRRERDEAVAALASIRRCVPLPLSCKPDVLDLQSEFLTALCRRWEKGEREYADLSFHLPGAEICDEMAEEVVDVAGWGLIVFAWLKRLRASHSRLAKLEELRAAVAAWLDEWDLAEPLPETLGNVVHALAGIDPPAVAESSP